MLQLNGKKKGEQIIKGWIKGSKDGTDSSIIVALARSLFGFLKVDTHESDSS